MKKYRTEIVLIVLELLLIGFFLPEIIESGGSLLTLVFGGIVIGIEFASIVDKKMRTN